jgi:C4-dicarboxylate-specific signal transduction histidine kinase
LISSSVSRQDVSLIKKLRSHAWFPSAVRAAGAATLILFSYLAVSSGFNFEDGRFWLLVAVIVAALLGDYVTSIALALIAVVCLEFFFAAPTFSLRVEQEEDVLALVVFLGASIAITSLAAKVRRTSEEELLQTRADLARFGRVAMLGELTASIAHELNQPLGGLVSSSNACRRWLLNQPPNIDRANQSLDRIIRDADRATTVLERVRSMANNRPPRKLAVNVTEALSEVILITRGDVERNQITLETKFVDGVILVWADRIQFQQVCLNLIVNGIEALKDVNSSPRVLAVGAERDCHNHVTLTVADTGAGIVPEKSGDIFDAFVTSKPDGMGMGLAISRSIVEAHGGRLWASANVPRGAKFQFTVPIYRG